MISKKIHSLLKWMYHKRDILLVVFFLYFSALVHGWNMTNYPYFENDEATYFSQAWSVLSQAKLAPYTYWYDHAPFGWIFTSLWIGLTGDPFTFGFSLNSARVFMLFIHIFSTYLLYRASKKITHSSLAAAITVFFFSMSPLAVYFQRRMLLDNLMVFWLLLSLNFIVFAKQRLWFFVASALCFALAVLTKENAIFALPVFLGLVATQSHPKQRLFVVFEWIAVTGMVISIYPFYAFMKHELFPAGSWFGGTEEHVSLLGALKLQSGRGTGLPFWNSKSDFRINYTYWLGQDWVFIVGGTTAFFIQALVSFWRKSSRMVFFLTLSILAFLLSGKLVINFYIIPLIPFFALCIGNTVSQLLYAIAKYQKIVASFIGIILLVFIGAYYGTHQVVWNMFNSDETRAQVEAVEWVKKNLPAESYIVMDYGMIDLMNARHPGDVIFPNADWYWKVDFDPDVKTKKLENNSKKIEYIMMNQQMYKDISSYSFSNPLTYKALASSSQIRYFGPPYKVQDTLGLFVQNFPNGDWVSIYKQNTLQDVLQLSWDSYKAQFILPGGRVVEPKTGVTTSRDVGFTLLRAVIQNDKETFARVWSWSETNLQREDALFVSSYSNVKDTSSDADQFIAFALASAAKRWRMPEYRTSAVKIVDSIWENETVLLGKRRYLVAGTWTAQSGRPQYTMNLANFTPAFYKTFSDLNPNNNWMALRENMYSALNTCSGELMGSTFMPPNWCDVSDDGKILETSSVDKNASEYSYESFRTLWNLSLDADQNKDSFAREYFQRFPLFAQEWKDKQKIYSRYDHDGKPVGQEESLDQYAATLSYFKARNDLSTAQAIYDGQVNAKFQQRRELYSWSDSEVIFHQNWVWLNVWLFTTDTSAVLF